VSKESEQTTIELPPEGEIISLFVRQTFLWRKMIAESPPRLRPARRC